MAARLGMAKAKIVPSEWVLAEFLSHSARPPLRQEALRALAILEASLKVTIIPADHATFGKALRLFRSRSDKSWSLVDCTSMVLCRRHRVRHVCTGDRHFLQAGLTILL